MGFGSLGAPELLVILVIVVVLFGAGKLAGVGGALGTSIREFREGMDGKGKEPAPQDEAKAGEAKAGETKAS